MSDLEPSQPPACSVQNDRKTLGCRSYVTVIGENAWWSLGSPCRRNKARPERRSAAAADDDAHDRRTSAASRRAAAVFHRMGL